MVRGVIATLVGAVLLSFAAPALAKEAPALDPNLKINELQVLGTHNSYSAGMDPKVAKLFAEKAAPLFANLADRMPAPAKALFHEEHPNPMDVSEMLKYNHPALTTQLDLGVRSLEIDVNADPKGGAYSDPAGYRILRQQGVTDLLPYDTTDLDKPGFKVFHIADVDFRSTCPTLRLCLRQVRTWSDAHPGHVPLYIMIEAKVQDVPILPGATHSVPFSAAIFDDLDKELVEVMGRDRIIAPDDVRGRYPTLNAAVRAKNWPKLRNSRGKVLFMLSTATGPTGATAYLEGHAGLKGRMAFLRSEPGQDYGAFLLYDNAIVRAEEIKKHVAEGYLVRTRSDIETYEAKVNDLTRAKAAFASGAQIVSTDFERAGNAYGTPYLVKLPGGDVARCNAIAAPRCPK
jgi:hypothetical protein